MTYFHSQITIPFFVQQSQQFHPNQWKKGTNQYQKNEQRKTFTGDTKLILKKNNAQIFQNKETLLSKPIETQQTKFKTCKNKK